MTHYAIKGNERIEITEAQARTYEALRIAAEKIAANNYAELLADARKRKVMVSHIRYSPTWEHKQLIEAMPRVLAGTLDCESAMALLWQYDTMKQRYSR